MSNASNVSDTTKNGSRLQSVQEKAVSRANKFKKFSILEELYGLTPFLEVCYGRRPTWRGGRICLHTA